MSLFSGFEKIVRQQEPLARHTWFQLGGPAEYFAEPNSVDELAALVRRCREAQVPVRVLGGGSNILVRDEGVPGMVIHLSAAAFTEITVSWPGRIGRRRRQAGTRHFGGGSRGIGRFGNAGRHSGNAGRRLARQRRQP